MTRTCKPCANQRKAVWKLGAELGQSSLLSSCAHYDRDGSDGGDDKRDN